MYALINVRVFYKKLGRAKYISALDVNRMAARALKRADNEFGLKLWYTEGFNPHLYVSFALPLSLGYESEYEAMDIRVLDDNADLNKVKEIIGKVFPVDMPVIHVALQQDKPTDITSAMYKVEYLCKNMSSVELIAKFKEFFNQGEILVMKRSKKGMKEVDIKPDCSVLALNEIDGGFSFELTACAGTQKTINPSLLTSAFSSYIGVSEDNDESFIRVVRKAIYVDGAKLFV